MAIILQLKVAKRLLFEEVTFERCTVVLFFSIFVFLSALCISVEKNIPWNSVIIFK